MATSLSKCAALILFILAGRKIPVSCCDEGLLLRYRANGKQRNGHTRSHHTSHARGHTTMTPMHQQQAAHYGHVACLGSRELMMYQYRSCLLLRWAGAEASTGVCPITQVEDRSEQRRTDSPIQHEFRLQCWRRMLSVQHRQPRRCYAYGHYNPHPIRGRVGFPSGQRN